MVGLPKDAVSPYQHLPGPTGSLQGIPLAAEHREVGLTLPREKAFLGWSTVKCMPTLKPSSLMCRSYNPTMYFPAGWYQSPVTTAS